MEQSRFRSPIVWGAIFAQVVALLVTFGVVEFGHGEQVRGTVTVVLELLVLFGVLNNPTERDGF